MLGLYSLLMFGVTGDFGIPIFVLTMGFLIIGIVFIIAAITSSGLKTINEK
jgi:hypothetical protein